MKNCLFIVLDSARFDSFRDAHTPNMDQIGSVERRFSYASWTSPSHFVYLMGMVPHRSPVGVFASEVYKKDYCQWGEWLSLGETKMGDFVPGFSLTEFLAGKGYRTTGFVSMPIINPLTPLSLHFEQYELMDAYNQFDCMIEKVPSSDGRPLFLFLNVGETHYPYCIPSQEMPSIRGENGIFRRVDDRTPGMGEDLSEFYYHTSHMKRFREAQIQSIEAIDRQIPHLLSRLTGPTHVIITSDHGELFGEDGYFGHGPIQHEKVFEIPYLSGTV